MCTIKSNSQSIKHAFYCFIWSVYKIRCLYDNLWLKFFAFYQSSHDLQDLICIMIEYCSIYYNKDVFMVCFRYVESSLPSIDIFFGTHMILHILLRIDLIYNSLCNSNCDLYLLGILCEYILDSYICRK